MKDRIVHGAIWLALVASGFAAVAVLAEVWLFTFKAWGMALALAVGWLPAVVAAALALVVALYCVGVLAATLGWLVKSTFPVSLRSAVPTVSRRIQ